MFELTMSQQVIRDRITEESVRKRDAHEIVDWIHGLEDESAGLERRIRALEAINADLYEALELLVDTNDNGGWPSAAIVVARAALVKARGEQ